MKKIDSKITKMIPSYGKSLIDDVKLMRATRKQTSKDLELNYMNLNKILSCKYKMMKRK